MVNLVKEAQESKKKIILSAMVAVLVIIAATPLFIVSGISEPNKGTRIGLTVIGIIVLIFGIAIACILDREAGTFECPKCGAYEYCKKVLTR